MEWIQLHPKATPEMLGFIPEFLNENDPRPAREQLDDNYSHGGGWRSMPGFTMLPNGDLKYPGDPPFALLAETKLRDEIIRVYNYAWVVILQPDGSFEVCHMD
jgi:hypothetical protein